MADKKISVLASISAAEAKAAGTAGYIPYVDADEADPADRNKKMMRDDLAQLYPKFSVLSGTDWDGSSKYLVLTANKVLTFTPGTNQMGQLLLIQDGTGSRTVSINGSSVTINTAADAQTLVTYQYIDGLDQYIFLVGTPGLAVSGGGGGGGVTLNTPGSFNATAISDTEIDLTWTDTNSSPNESGYTIYFNGINNFGSASVLATKAAGSTSHNHTGLSASTSFYYWIKANGDGTTTSDSATTTDSATTMAGGGSAVFFTFTSRGGSQVIVDDAPGQFTSPGGSTYAVDTKTLAGDGYIEMLIPDSSSQVVTIGVDAIGGTTNFPWAAYIYPNAGNLYHEATDTGVAWAAGDIIRLERIGTTLYFKKSSGGGAFTTVYTYPGTYSGALYAHLAWATAATAYDVQGEGWA
jgi:hypothetical protein